MRAQAAPRCRNGALCRYLASGYCQYYHAPEDFETYPESDAAPVELRMPDAGNSVANDTTKRWNVLVNSKCDNTEQVKAVAMTRAEKPAGLENVATPPRQ